ncbi:Peroxisomal (S)-2-hydroxy-acid oxidase GLO4 [Morus notabilis]|uniref:Peroxisomal (S)-2-hydroxy-acid oxidase GLO4 n=1 Tax=Morus notabilis TaxID=981085 RepID=W9RX94_9ROSA|nr:Peroxisomal (S)-2-hydroxy-acid oxidase GLO4 [Morus notabilis]
MNNRPHLNYRGPNSYSSEQIYWPKEFPMKATQRPPLRSVNNYRYMSPTRRQYNVQQNLCRHYAQGRCYYGDRLKMAAEPVNVNEFQELARQVLPKMYYDYYSGGAEDQFTLKENLEAFQRIK